MIIIILKDIHQFHEIFLCSQLKVTQGNLTSRNGAAKYQPTNFETPNERGERSKNKERKSYQSEETQPPCNLSSSIYYGGQDNYSSSTTNPDAYKKDGEEGDSESASRGNWWEGSFNY
ncbi:plant/protein [Arabidopsis thaliana]|uniref:Plant/protein n=1 Tax=Arabidopsis thaliana TaxID=3702 RepID=A0A1P8B0K6_ARATH|nr:plant/protein [Arabidopsis thaliana]ANM62445.1 plant/protein [Arabidopsis thaliana]|eukprot:NP_001324602.1 plant/protein [Arabidopsis thaliana]